MNNNLTLLGFGIKIDIYTRLAPQFELLGLGYSFYIHPLPDEQKMYNCVITVHVHDGRSMVMDTTQLLNIWRKLASCIQNLRHLKKLSLELQWSGPDGATWTTEFMMALHPVMQDMYASLSPGQCLVVYPEYPQNILRRREKEKLERGEDEG